MFGKKITVFISFTAFSICKFREFCSFFHGKTCPMIYLIFSAWSEDVLRRKIQQWKRGVSRSVLALYSIVIDHLLLFRAYISKKNTKKIDQNSLISLSTYLKYLLGCILTIWIEIFEKSLFKKTSWLYQTESRGVG